tara:strand:+ start:456 stop:1079 length:624 start_codon:yes stop_codon:yes gene_type:complete
MRLKRPPACGLAVRTPEASTIADDGNVNSHDAVAGKHRERETGTGMGDVTSPPNPPCAWTTRQRAEQVAKRFLANAPFLGDRTGMSSRKWDDADPTWWSDAQNAWLVRRSDMLVAIEKYRWRPRTLSSSEVDALKRVLRRPPTTRPGVAKVARTPPSRVKGFDAPVHASAAPPPSRQPCIAFPVQLAESAPDTRGPEVDARSERRRC